MRYCVGLYDYFVGGGVSTMSGTSSAESFFTWLGSRVSASQLSMFYDVFGRIDDYVADKRLVAGHIYDIRDVSRITQITFVMSKEKHAWWSRDPHRKQQIMSALTHMKDYIAGMKTAASKSQPMPPVSTVPARSSQPKQVVHTDATQQDGSVVTLDPTRALFESWLRSKVTDKELSKVAPYVSAFDKKFMGGKLFDETSPSIAYPALIERAMQDIDPVLSQDSNGISTSVIKEACGKYRRAAELLLAYSYELAASSKDAEDTARKVDADSSFKNSYYLTYLKDLVGDEHFNAYLKVYDHLDKIFSKMGLISDVLVETSDMVSLKKCQQVVRDNDGFKVHYSDKQLKWFSAALSHLVKFTKDNIPPKQQERKDMPAVKQVIKATNDAQAEHDSMDPGAHFDEWMQKSEFMSDAARHNYINAIRDLERFAKEHGYASHKLLTDDSEIIRSTILELYRDPDFMKHNDARSKFYDGKVKKLMAFMHIADIDLDTIAADEPPTPNEDRDHENVIQIENDFMKWLSKDMGLADATCRNYVAAVHAAEEFAIKHGMEFRISCLDHSKASKDADKILNDFRFIRINRESHNQFSAGLRKFIRFIAVRNEASDDMQASDKTNDSSDKTGQTSIIDLRDTGEPFSDFERAFFDWMLKDGLAKATCGYNVSNARAAKRFADGRSIAFDLTPDGTLLGNRHFRRFDDAGDRRFSNALNRLRQFLELPDYTASASSQTHSETTKAQKRMTIIEAAATVLKYADGGLTIQEILDGITEGELYEFNAADPYSVLSTEIYRACLGVKTAYHVSRDIFRYETNERGERLFFLLGKDARNEEERPEQDGARLEIRRQISDMEQQELVTSEQGDLPSMPSHASLAERRSSTSQRPMQDDKIARYKNVLMQDFPKGLKVDSLGADQLADAYKDRYGSLPPDDEAAIEKILPSLGTLRDGFVYSDGIIANSGLKEKILKYIDGLFAAGVQAVYYGAIFDHFEQECKDVHIADDRQLIDYLDEVLKGTSLDMRDYYIASNKDQPDHHPEDEVKRVLLDNAVPMTRDEIYRKLEHITKCFLDKALEDEEVIRSGKGEFFHISSIALDDDDVSAIEGILTSAIDSYGYMSAGDLFKELGETHPDIIGNNAPFGELGLRKAIGDFVRGKFVLNGFIFSAPGDHHKAAEAFGLLGEKHDTFTMTQVMELANEITNGKIGSIYMEKILDSAIRVSADKFISTRLDPFDAEAVDKAIAKICVGRYVPMSAFTDAAFMSFPSVGYKWNLFLLESYLWHHHGNYRHLNNNFSQTDCFGAVVRSDADGIDTLDDLFAEVLADSGIDDTKMTEETALDYLCKHKYIAIRRYKDINKCIAHTFQLRNLRKVNQ